MTTIAIKDALLHVPGPEHRGAEAFLAYAADFARHFDTAVTGLAFAFDLPRPASLRTLPDTAETDAERAARKAESTAALKRAESVFAAAGAVLEPVLETCLAAEAPDIFVGYGRLRDLVLLYRDAAASDTERTLLTDILLEAGRPVLVAPAGATAFSAKRILIAWDYSRAAARAVADAMPFLVRAAEVRVVTVDDEGVSGPRADTVELARHLARRGIDITVDQTASGGRGIDAVLFDHAAAVGADLVVMGAYGHSRLRESLVGGVTRSVLEGAPLPVLMSH